MKNKKAVIISLLGIIVVGVGLSYMILNGVSSKGKNTVSEKTYKDFSITDVIEIKIGEEKQIEVKDIDKNVVKFLVADKAIASVNAQGLVKGISAGETEIIAKANNKEKKCKIIIGEQVTNSDSVTEQEKSKPDEKESVNKPAQSSGGQSKPNGGSATPPATKPIPEKKPEPAPAPKPNVTYSYMGKQVYNWVLETGGKVIEDKAYLGDPDCNGYGEVRTIDFLVRVQNVRTPDTDYIITVDGNTIISDYYPEVFNNCFEDGEAIKAEILTGKSSFSVNGRNYTCRSSKLGFVITVSAKAK